MLPNMKLGLDRRTGVERFLTTWKSREDPGTGEYSYRIEPNELPRIVLFKGSTRVWWIPAWFENQWKAKHEATPTIIFHGTYVNNRDEVSTFYTLINASNVSRPYQYAQHMESRRLNGKMVAVVVTSAVLTSVLTITLVFWSVMKKRRRGLGIKDSEEENGELPIFDMVTIAGATNNFSEKNKIGEGSFGSVYKVIFLFD
ncbi:hypothetical protein Vadar_015520 [Vaccinium darrowii]|uniref:Uncharacterized protein n=1 Tax=Vaccinium darrowii TaxID=229202 RepID=A0ACB7X110_9ERIC|nr:hypothetical protein Vadar_015520 [Vaccinium darrowii]